MSKLIIDPLAIQIKHLRESLNLSQVDVAEQIGVGLRTYQRIESSETIPTIDIVFKLADIFHVRLDEIFYPEEKISLDKNIFTFKGEEESKFLNYQDVLDSKILEIKEHNIFADILSGREKIEKLMNVSSFYNSPYCLSISNPRHTLLNLSTQNTIASNQIIIPTTLGHQCKKKLGSIWASLIRTQIKYFEMQTLPTYGDRGMIKRSKNIFVTGEKDYFVLTLASFKDVASPIIT